jgi:hypothetical protein
LERLSGVNTASTKIQENKRLMDGWVKDKVVFLKAQAKTNIQTFF